MSKDTLYKPVWNIREGEELLEIYSNKEKSGNLMTFNEYIEQHNDLFSQEYIEKIKNTLIRQGSMTVDLLSGNSDNIQVMF